MPNYLNQIESDLYKLYSITNGSGEVVEMVAELKEKYLKAKAYESKFENEYKNYKVDFIQLLDELDEGRWAHEPDMRAELDEVYAEAAKADECEVKARAFDNLVDVAYWHFERIHPDDDNRLQYESFYDDIRDEFKKLESGEYDAKK